MITIEKLLPPYTIAHLQLLPEQEQFITRPEEILSCLKKEEVPFIVRLKGEDIGFFILRRSHNDHIRELRHPSRCTFFCFLIDMRHQGKGFASQALSILPKVAVSTFKNITGIVLTVNCRNEQAYKLYEKNGFRDTEELYYGGDEGPQYIMVMDLPYNSD